MGDERDMRGGAYDPVNEWGRPQPDRVRHERKPDQNPQWGEPLPGNEPVLPEGLRRERVGPGHKPIPRLKDDPHG
jgi:hypothetical protein